MSISLYCNCFKDRVNKKTEYNQKNLMLGSISYESQLKSSLFYKNFIFDDTGDNISHLNKWFGQLTGLYWVWKNTSDEIVGTNTYRLFWGDYFLNHEFKKKTLYIPKKLDLKHCLHNKIEDTNIYDHYSHCHGEINLISLYDLSNQNLISIKPYMIENLKHEYMIHPFNMFISERTVFDKVCFILFEVLFKFFETYKCYFDEYLKIYQQIRILDFLSERILHILYTNIDYYFSDIDIETISITDIDHNS